MLNLVMKQRYFWIFLKQNFWVIPLVVYADFVEYWKEHTWNESNEGKLKVLYMMLCVAMDRILKKPDGSIAFNITPSKLNPSYWYRKFIS